MPTRRHFTATLIATLTTTGLAASAGMARAQSGQAASIAGAYNARGRYPDGTAYSGWVEIAQNGAEVAFYWSIDGQSYQGLGRIDGRIVTVDWGSATPIVYVIMGRELHGTWDNGTALERLVPR